jgi:hypothetical protein
VSEILLGTLLPACCCDSCMHDIQSCATLKDDSIPKDHSAFVGYTLLKAPRVRGTFCSSASFDGSFQPRNSQQSIIVHHQLCKRQQYCAECLVALHQVNPTSVFAQRPVFILNQSNFKGRSQRSGTIGLGCVGSFEVPRWR